MADIGWLIMSSSSYLFWWGIHIVRFIFETLLHKYQSNHTWCGIHRGWSLRSFLITIVDEGVSRSHSVKQSEKLISISPNYNLHFLLKAGDCLFTKFEQCGTYLSYQIKVIFMTIDILNVRLRKVQTLKKKYCTQSQNYPWGKKGLNQGSDSN